MIVIDCETTGLDYHYDVITHIGTYDGLNFVMRPYAPIFCWPYEPDERIMHNGKFDTLMGYAQDYHYDTMLLSHLYDSRQQHSLDNLGKLYVGEGKWGDPKMLQAIKRGEFWMLPRDDQMAYLKRDCTLTYRLFHFFEKNLSSDLWRLYNTFDHPLNVALTAIERNGFNIDMGLLAQYHTQLEVELQKSETLVRKYTGNINLNSPKQLLSSLQSITGMQLTSTDTATLGALQPYSPLAERLLTYRKLQKYLGTYIKNIETFVYRGKVYPQFHLAGEKHGGTETGRTSSSNPNLQNQPRVDSGPVNIRRLFIASPGCILIAADYSQLELKIAAYLSGEDNLLHGDIHQKAATILGVTRTVAKNCNFARLYGANAQKIHTTSGGSKHVKKFIGWFTDSFPRAIAWTEKVTQQCSEEKLARTYLGRVRIMGCEKDAANTIVQGSAADVAKEALLKAHRRGIKVLGIIHDELLCEVPTGEVYDAAHILQESMTSALELHADIHAAVNLAVSMKVGNSWGELTPLDMYHV